MMTFFGELRDLLWRAGGDVAFRFRVSDPPKGGFFRDGSLRDTFGSGLAGGVNEKIEAGLCETLAVRRGETRNLGS
jgi:hypothetical protein